MGHEQSASYEGRSLPRPDEELVDQGLGFDLATLGRRRFLRALGLGATVVGLAACGDSSTSSSPATSTTSAAAAATGEIPDETAGPYPGDGSNGPDVLTQSGIVRSDIRSSFGTGSATAAGVPTTIELTITDLVRKVPFSGVAVYVWHCNREGGYSLYSQGIENENYLRGVQVAGTDGVVRFTSIFPACYTGRWPHIHFEVYPDQAAIADASNAVATSQVALPAATCTQVYAVPGYEQSVQNLMQVTLDSDNVFGDDAGASQLATVTGDVTAGLTVALAVGVDTSTTPTGGQAVGDGAPAGAPPSGARPSGPPPSGARPPGARPSGAPPAAPPG